MMVPVFKLADQSPKPLGHRNWPIILFLLDLLTASSEKKTVQAPDTLSLVEKGPQDPIIVLSHDIGRTRNGGGGPVYIYLCSASETLAFFVKGQMFPEFHG